ncbi:hypothetical protein B0H66DRAFT_557964 [Apodospora peruviana]|uniref:COP9 signalosome complex subunit 12 n=1 Tax=Apodospora peruviana TaxID=516989 RepID=A0AAE0M4Q6_9PEZI|nr:hypothetical protein B0H66DRAFT_557964 [Apodospora peruviana]
MSLLVEFLSSIRRFVLEQNGDELRKWLLVENNVPDIYFQLARELKTSFPANSNSVENLVDNCLPEENDVPESRGSPWPGFNSFMKEYLEYWRDADFSNLVKVHARLSDLLNSCANALANPTYGAMLLQTSMSLSEALSKLVMGLTRQPELLSQIQGGIGLLGEEGNEKKSIVELAADIIQKIFTSCLTDRSSTRWQPPKGKKVAVYLFANLTLKLLFACDKSRLAIQMFTNLSTSGPALALYPASQRVTFLYYLGRFNFDQGDYWRAHQAFEAAYLQCPPQFMKHRRQILTYWVPTNLLLGRFPSLALLQRPEAAGFLDIFLPICASIRRGNFVDFHTALFLSRDWLWAKGFYLTLLYRLKPLVWRSFTRRTFLLAWQGSVGGGNRASVPTLSFQDMVTTATYVQKQLEGYTPAPKRAATAGLPPKQPQRKLQVNPLFMKAVTNSSTAAAEADGGGDSLVPPPAGPRFLMPSEGLIFGNKRPDVKNIEAVIAGLVYAGLLNGFIARRQGAFAIEGAKRFNGDPVKAGWPVPYESVMERFKESWQDAVAAYESGESPDPPGEFEDVPGWVKGDMFSRRD